MVFNLSWPRRGAEITAWGTVTLQAQVYQTRAVRLGDAVAEPRHCKMCSMHRLAEIVDKSRDL